MNKNQLSTIPVKNLVKQEAIKKMLSNTLKGKATQFTTSLINVVNNNKALAKVDQMSVIQSAMVAASLDLPIDQNLGYMWLVPYKGKATPQIGYKGYIQLAQRTGQYKAMNAVVVHEGELESWNPLTEEAVFDPAGRVSDEIIGYIGYFKLINGFEKTVFWSKDDIDNHRKRFSKMSGGDNPTGVWATDFDAMALKTVLRNLLSKWGPMSIEMNQALSLDENEPPKSVDADEVDYSETTEQLIADFNQSQERKTVDAGETEQQELL